MSSLNDISSNSDSGRTVEPDVIDDDYFPVEKVSILSRFLGIFGIEPDLGGALGSVWEDVIKPTFLDGCRDSMYTLADYFFGGGGRRSGSSRGSSDKKGHTAYSDKFKGSRASAGKTPNQAVYAIPYNTREEANEKLGQLWDVVNQHDVVSIEDYLIIGLGKTTSNYMYGKWGWTAKDLDGVRPTRNGDGTFTLNLPKPRPLKDE